MFVRIRHLDTQALFESSARGSVSGQSGAQNVGMGPEAVIPRAGTPRGVDHARLAIMPSPGEAELLHLIAAQLFACVLSI